MSKDVSHSEVYLTHQNEEKKSILEAPQTTTAMGDSSLTPPELHAGDLMCEGETVFSLGIDRQTCRLEDIYTLLTKS